MQRQTTIATAKTIDRKWYVVDIAGKPLGRAACEIARRLSGKNKPIYTPNVDCGDYIIVINAAKVSLSGDKEHTKNYYRVSGYTGGLKVTSAGTMLQDKPERMVELAVKGMLPKGSLGRQMFKKLFVYADADHKHEAQQPEVLEIK